MGKSEIHNERPGSVLTPSQREQLSNPDADLSPAAERMARGRIRKRIGAGMIDLSTILRKFPDDDLDKSFTQKFSSIGGVLDPKRNIAGAIGVLYLGSIARPETVGVRGLETVTTEDSMFMKPLVRPGAFENRAEEGIEQALIRRGIDVESVDVTVEIETRGEMPERGEYDLGDMSYNELRRLELAGEIGREEYDREMRRRLEIDDDEE